MEKEVIDNLSYLPTITGTKTCTRYSQYAQHADKPFANTLIVGARQNLYGK